MSLSPLTPLDNSSPAAEVGPEPLEETLLSSFTASTRSHPPFPDYLAFCLSSFFSSLSYLWSSSLCHSHLTALSSSPLAPGLPAFRLHVRSDTPPAPKTQLRDGFNVSLSWTEKLHTACSERMMYCYHKYETTSCSYYCCQCCRLKKLLVLLTSQSCEECTQTAAGEELHLSFFYWQPERAGFHRYILCCATNCTE